MSQTDPHLHRRTTRTTTDLEASPPQNNSNSNHVPSPKGTKLKLLDRLRGKGLKSIPSTRQSLKNVLCHSPLNFFIIFIPLSWAAYFVNKNEVDGKKRFNVSAQFSFSFLAIIPLESTFDWLGEELAIYTGSEIGDLIEITLNNAVEAALGIFLLIHDRLRLLQTTVIGVLLLHLLLIPGTSFLTGGARIAEQHLHAPSTELNHSLLTIGVMTLVLPAAFFAALDRGNVVDLTRVVVGVDAQGVGIDVGPTGGVGGGDGFNTEGLGKEGLIPLLSDQRRGEFLKFSRALAVILLGVYVCSRIFLHNPPGPGISIDRAQEHHPAFEHQHQQQHKKESSHASTVLNGDGGGEGEEEEERRDPKVNQWVGVGVLCFTVALMSVTAEWLVFSIESVQEKSGIQEEWFGLFLLPIISFSADALLTILFYTHKLLKILRSSSGKLDPPETSTSGIAIDLSVQFILFWLPVFVLLGWCLGREMMMLFDLWEVVVVVASCFLVNYVTADGKTNWVEGVVMIAFYIMIAIVAWFYPGQIEVKEFVGAGSVASAVRFGPSDE